MAQVFDTPINTTDQSLDRVLAAGLPVALVFVDGHSALDETLNRLASQNAGQVKVNARENPQSAQRYQVRATPALVTVKSKETVTRAEPVTPAELEQHIAYLLGRGPRPQAKPAAPSASTQTAGPNGARAATAAAGRRSTSPTLPSTSRCCARPSRCWSTSGRRGAARATWWRPRSTSSPAKCRAA
jgi:thioredoxin 1